MARRLYMKATQLMKFEQRANEMTHEKTPLSG